MLNQLLFANKTIEGDSLYTGEYISRIYMAEPGRTLSLLDGTESKKTIPLRIVHELCSRVYHNMYMAKLALLYAKKSYLPDSVSQEGTKRLLTMTVDLVELTMLMSDHKESVRYALDGIKLAQKEKDEGAESKLLFCIGENKWQSPLKKGAYGHLDKAIKLLQGISSELEMAILSYFYGMKMGYLLDDPRSKEALEVGLKHEKLLKDIAKLPEKTKGSLGLQYTYLYIEMSYICYLEGKYDQVEKCYQRYLSTESSQTPDGKTYAIPYLLVFKQYQKVVDQRQDFKKLTQEQGTVNLQYISILQKEVRAYKGLENFEKVTALRKSTISIIGGINNRDKQNAALELNAIHKADEQEEYITEQTLQLGIRNISFVFSGCVTCLILLVLWRIQHHTTIVKYENKMLARFINEKLAERVENKQLFINGDAEDSVAIPLDLEPEAGFFERDDLSPDEVVESREGGNKNKKVFEEPNRIVVQDQLYLSPELSRKGLAQIVHLNNARFVRVIKEDIGTNFNGYINELRINYVIQLLKQHPSYTIRTIADGTGFNSMPILYSMFKKKTGMAPYGSKKTQKSLD